MNITSEEWGTYNGKEVCRFRLTGTNGSFVEITNYGATIVSIVVPDNKGELGPVILGFNELDGYHNDKCYIGSTIGRVANRISNAVFKLNNKSYQLEANDFPNSNHSGASGFHTRVFDFEIKEHALVLKLSSETGEGGFPGKLDFTVSYYWTDSDQLFVIYEAITDEDTPANFTNHAYFNLSSGVNNVLNHRLTILAPYLLEADPTHIPTGKIIPTGEKTFLGNKIKDRLIVADKLATGINSYYVVEKKIGKKSSEPVAILDCPDSGRRLIVYTSYPGVMVYTGDYLLSDHPGLTGENYHPFDGLCLECQHYPDAPNQPSFPSIMLKAGENYFEQIVYEFRRTNDRSPALGNVGG